MRFSFIIILVGIVFIWGCEEPITSTKVEVEDPVPVFQNIELNFFTIAKGSNISRASGNFLIKSEFEYQSHFGRSSDNFNFGNEMIVAVYKGEVPLSEHDYTITKILERENDVLVTMIFESCIECNTSTSAPFHVVGLDRSNKTFVYEEVKNN